MAEISDIDMTGKLRPKRDYEDSLAALGAMMVKNPMYIFPPGVPAAIVLLPVVELLKVVIANHPEKA
jgi:hypothetical protein